MFINFDNLFIYIFCYIIGSIPFGLLISLLLKKNDPRLVGSKNIGATNIARTSGWKLGLLTLIFDILKGYLTIFFFQSQFANLELLILCVFLGHLFPIWIKFKGGKGIAVLIGCLTAYNVYYGIFYVFSWLIVAIISRYSSLSALIASINILILVFFINEKFFSVLLIIVVMIFFKHTSNIKRLLIRKESRIILKK